MIDRVLPATGAPLPPSWALQDPQDWLDALWTAVPAAVADAGIDPGTIVGIGTDFTASTPLPVTRDGTPLCKLARFVDRPHAYPKLWKHHAAQQQAERVTAVAAERRRDMARALRRPHLLGVAVRQGAPGARGGPRGLRRHRALDRGRRLDRLAALRPSRRATSCTAGYKGLFQDGSYPSASYLRALNPDFADFVGRAGRLAALAARASAPAS